jgi:hypothetical protein
MEPNLKRKLETFKQRALMISSRGELTTQALANIQSSRSTGGVRTNASTSGGRNSHGEVGVPLSETIGEPYSGASSSANNVNTDTVAEGCPAAATPLCKKPRNR